MEKPIKPTKPIPEYCLMAYALFYSKHGSRESFKQTELEWIMSASMRKKVFSVLLNSGWIAKKSRDSYRCIEPKTAIKGLLQFNVFDIIKKADKDYEFTGLTAVEIWSDFSYVQRGFEKSPYFMKVLKKDLRYWKAFFNKEGIPNYVDKGTTIGEYIILFPVNKLDFVKKEELKVESLKKSLNIAKMNDLYLYAYGYMVKNYGNAAT